MKKTIVVSLVLAAVFAGNLVAGDELWLTDLAQAKKVAAEKKLPILVDFSGSDWCGWCKKLDQEVFSKEEFKAYAKDNLVLMLADFPAEKEQTEQLKKQNAELAATYNVKGFPTIIILDTEGKVLGQTGYRPGGPGKYVEHLKGILAENKKK